MNRSPQFFGGKAAMNGRTVQVTALQLQAHERAQFDVMWPQICARVRNAAKNGADLIVLPEGTVPAYVIGTNPVESSVTEQALGDIQYIAKEMSTVIVYGSVRSHEGHQYNSALVVDADGSLAGSADKCFLWHFDRKWFASGTLRAPIRTSIGTLGVMICADGRIPTIASQLADAGAEILVMPTAWVTSGRNPQQLENAQADLLAGVRAQENNLPFIAANKIGTEADCVAYCGKSQIIDRTGKVLALGSQDRSEDVSAQVVLGSKPPMRHRTNQRAPVAACGPMRIAITPFRTADTRILGTLGAEKLVAPVMSAQSDDDLPAAVFEREEFLFDPAALDRLAGYRIAVYCCQGRNERKTVERFARARALEMRMYVVIIVPDQYAFAVDPDGTIICGTFDGFHVAMFSFDPARAHNTMVAPDTDIEEGLRLANLALAGGNISG